MPYKREYDKVWNEKAWKEIMLTPEMQAFMRNQRRLEEGQGSSTQRPVSLRPNPTVGVVGSSSSAGASTSSGSSSKKKKSSKKKSSGQGGSSSKRRDTTTIPVPSASAPTRNRLMTHRLNPEEFRRVGDQVSKERRMAGNLSTAGSVITPPNAGSTSAARHSGRPSSSRR